MTENLDIAVTVENKLISEKRDINVYHHSTRSAHIISHNSSITLPLRTDGEDDYLHISVVSGPGNLWKDCMIGLPSWANFEFASEGKLTLTHSSDAKRTLLKIPPGPPTWQLKMTRPNGCKKKESEEENVIVGNDGTG
jgi:hypothetical protein